MLATLPFDKMGSIFVSGKNLTYFKLLGALKLVRVMRLGRIIAYLRVTAEVKAGLQIIKLIFSIILYLHCFGCTFYYIAKSDKTWVPPINYNDGEANFSFLYRQSITQKYFTVLHAAVMILTGNDIGPRGTFQTVFLSGGLFMGAMINANMFGELAVLAT
jgi:hypothetical protein